MRRLLYNKNRMLYYYSVLATLQCVLVLTILQSNLPLFYCSLRISEWDDNTIH